MNSTILITTANNPPTGVPFLEMTNVARRIVTAKAATYFWAAQQVERIVIADATNSILLNGDEISVLERMHVNVEQICYKQNNELIRQRGKGYGEGELIQFALNNSALLKDEKSFFKCTGKLFCRNFPIIYKTIKQYNISNLFWRCLGEGDLLQPWADTRFFYTTKIFAENFLIPAYLEADDKIAPCEYHIFNLLNQYLSASKMLRPSLSGFSGGTNEQSFDLSLGALDMNYPCWLNVEDQTDTVLTNSVTV